MVSSPVEPLRNRTGRLTVIFLIVVTIGVALFSRLQSEPGIVEGGPMVGRLAPEIVVTNFDGREWRLSEHLRDDGRGVLLNLWGSWCAPCREEMPELSRFAQSHPEVMVVGVAVRDEVEAAAAFAESLELQYLTGIDATGHLRDLYVGFGMPALFLIDNTGTVIGQLEGGADLERIEEFVTNVTTS